MLVLAAVAVAAEVEPWARFSVDGQKIVVEAFTLQDGFQNRGDQNTRLHAFDLLETRKGSGVSFEVPNSDDCLVAPLMEESPAVSLTVAENQCLARLRSGSRWFANT